MNRKEKAVLVFLCASFLVGAGITFIRHKVDQKNLETITINKTINNVTSQHQIDSIDYQKLNTGDEVVVININTASNKELEALPGIGPVIAQRIVDYRRQYGSFTTKEGILKISGIGSKKFSAIKDKITINQ